MFVFGFGFYYFKIITNVFMKIKKNKKTKNDVISLIIVINKGAQDLALTFKL